MSENIIPEKVQEIISDVEETVTDTVEDLSDKTLSELSDIFVSIRNGADSMMRSKEAEAVKSAFYKLLSKIKSENGEENPLNNPFEVVEQNFKAMYADYKKERADFNRQQEEEREANLIPRAPEPLEGGRSRACEVIQGHKRYIPVLRGEVLRYGENQPGSQGPGFQEEP